MTKRIPNEPHKAVLFTAVGATVLIAVGAFVLSFAALTDLASRSGIDGSLAWIWPIIVDGMIVASTVAIVALNGHSRRAMIYPWSLLFFGAIVSTAANSVHAILTVGAIRSSIPPVVSALVAAMPPVVLLAITHLTVHMYQKRAEAAELHREHPALEEAAPEQPNPARFAPEASYQVMEHVAPALMPGPLHTEESPAEATLPQNRRPGTMTSPKSPALTGDEQAPAPLYEETVQALSPETSPKAAPAQPEPAQEIPLPDDANAHEPANA